MGNFSNNAITDVGKMMLADVQAGAVFTPTRIVIGSGSMPGGATTQGMTDVITPVVSIAINKKKRTPDGKCIFGGVYSNAEVTAAFYFRELALYAKAVYLNADGSVKSEGAETLYSYGNAGTTADYMPAYSTSTVVEKQIDLVTWVGNDAQVDLTIESGLFITHEDFDAHAARHAIGGDDPITPESIGAVPLDGRTSMTGNSLYLFNRCAQVGANAGRAVLNSYDTPASGDSYRGFAVMNKSDTADIARAACFAVRDPGEGEVLYRLYGEHNKPKAADVGAVSKAGDTLSGDLRLENFDNYFAIRKGRTLEDGKTHFLTVGVGQGGSTTLEHYTGDSESFDSAILDGRLELSTVAYNGNLNSQALVLKSDFTGSREYRIYGEHYKPTPADVGAVNKAGDTMTGNLGISKQSVPTIFMVDGETGGGARIQLSGNHLYIANREEADSIANYRTIIISNAKVQDDVAYALRFSDVRNNVTNYYTVLHTGNLATFGMGAVPASVE